MQQATDQKKTDYTIFLAQNQQQLAVNPMNPTLQPQLKKIQDTFSNATKACIDNENAAQSICMSTPQ